MHIVSIPIMFAVPPLLESVAARMEHGFRFRSDPAMYLIADMTGAWHEAAKKSQEVTAS